MKFWSILTDIRNQNVISDLTYVEDVFKFYPRVKQTHALFSFLIILKRKCLKSKSWAINTCFENKMFTIEISTIAGDIYQFVFKRFLPQVHRKYVWFLMERDYRLMVYKINCRSSNIRFELLLFSIHVRERKLELNWCMWNKLVFNPVTFYKLLWNWKLTALLSNRSMVFVDLTSTSSL